MPAKYELRQFSSVNSDREEMSGKDGGCYVRTATGFIIGLLCIAIAVGVGLIVHFAENRAIECVFPDNMVLNGGQSQGQSGNTQQVATTQAPSAPLTTTSKTTTTKPMLKDVRLPRSLLPIHYDLRLQPEMYSGKPENFVFNGHVTIKLNCTQATTNVTLHINKLNITKDTVRFRQTSGTGSTPNYVSHTEDKDRQFLIINLDKNTDAGSEYELSMDFVGPLKDDLQGFYLSSYMEGNSTVYLATTQFEPTDARKAFPCFDEPAMKATFAVTLVRQQQQMSLSNMQRQRSLPIANGYVEDVYAPSAKMSTYLLAFVIGRFESKTATTTGGLKYGAWARPESVEQTAMALDVGIKTIVNYEKYFDIKFPLSKQDMISLPDFAAGAMENWGLITYRETAMLFDPMVSSEANRQRVTIVITHELAHQVNSIYNDILALVPLVDGRGRFLPTNMHLGVAIDQTPVLQMYGLPRSPTADMIAVPDFGLGAMENWGLITYRETAMLFDPMVSSEANKQRVAVVITHELAHQWFGDLVTMAWWDDLWLNEGFATYVEHIGADFLYPDWKMFEQFVVGDLHKAFEFDSLVTSHPIYVPVDNPEEINEIFDTISYSKGGSIIRMMQFILGEETFKKGLTRYLRSHQYGNAKHDDLWQALAEQSKADNAPIEVKRIMDTWTLQMNYPVVTVQKQNGKLHVVQSRFLKNENAQDPNKYPSPFGYKWEIPFTYTTSSSPDFNPTSNDIHWITDTTKDIENVALGDDDWVLGNVQQYGVYRVNYEDSNWRALIQQLKAKHQVISNINRAQLINDAWSLARADKLSTEIALNMLEYLDQETDYVPWVAAVKQLGYLNDMLRKTELYGQFKSFMLSKITDPFKHFGMDDTNSTHVESLSRSEIVSLACDYGLPQCIQGSKLLFNQWIEDPDNNPIDPDLRSAVYCTAVAEGGEAEWNFAFEKYKAATVATEKRTLSQALACTTSTWLLSRYLDLSVTPDVVRKQDATSTLVYIAQNPVGQPLAWDFVRGRWDYLLNTYGKGVFSFTNLITGLTSSFNTKFQLKQLKDFLQEYPNMGTGSRAFQQAIEKTETNIKWMQRNKDVVSNWLADVGKSQDTSSFKDVRLPTHLLPDSYDITLRPNMYNNDPDTFNFTGSVKIYMTAQEVGRNVTLHALKLDIDEDSIKFGRTGGGNSPNYKGLRQTDKQRQFEIFYLDGDLESGVKYFMEMSFTGPLKGSLAGLYLSEYKRGNDTVYIATSQLEATDARRAFPCFDEPAMKAVFNVKLERQSHMKAISNMPIISNKTLSDGFVQDVFDESAKMSTYLLAFIVCDFIYTENVTVKGVEYRAWSRPESINQTWVALETGTILLDWYADYFGQDFPLPKQDMIALPDFAAGAMENWGLITYRETAMLYEPGVSSDSNLQRVKVVVAHELAHQWFGDLVTMKWWDDIWLNEGFATFVEYMGVDHVSPDFKMFDQFVMIVHGVLNLDSLVTSHPIKVEAYTPPEINGLFDGISYDKGGSVIRMMRFFLGENTFQKGLQTYLANRKYQNADHNDLWSALETEARKERKTIDVRAIMDTWILQMNYPVVTISNDNGKIKLTQERFLKDPNAKDPGNYISPYNYQWMIPVTYTTNQNPKFNVTDGDVTWLNDKQIVQTDMYPTGADDWVLGNILQYGVYRVNYDAQNWDNLIKQLNKNHKVINVLNRAQVIDDAFGLAEAKMLPMETALKTLDYLSNEEEYIPWSTAGGQLGYIHKMIADTELNGAYERFMQEKVQKQFARLGMNNTGSSLLTSYIRSEISGNACAYGITSCINEAKKLFNEYMGNPKVNPIDPGLKSTVYCTALREGGETEWDFIYDRYLTATVQAEKSRLLSALSCTRKPWILNRWLEYAMDSSIVRKQDAYRVFIGVGRNIVGRTIAWNFFRSNWDAIFEKYGQGSFSLGDIINGVTSSFKTEFQLQELKDFQSTHPDLGSGTRAFSQVIETTRAHIKWMSDNIEIVKTWLQKYMDV